MHKFTGEDIGFAVFDEPIEDRAAICAALQDAQEKNLYEFGILTKNFYITYLNNQMSSSINRRGFVATRANIGAILGKLDRRLPKTVYEIEEFAPDGQKQV